MNTAPGAITIGSFVISAEQIPTVASHAREWACDCLWGESATGCDVTAMLNRMSDREAIRNAARHYDGGIRQLVADAIADAAL